MATNVLDRLEALLAAATPGYWTREKPGVDASGWPAGTAVAGTPGRQTIYTNHRGGTFPSADCDMIAALRNAAPALIRLARAAIALDGMDQDAHRHARHCVEDNARAAIKALGEVRL